MAKKRPELVAKIREYFETKDRIAAECRTRDAQFAEIRRLMRVGQSVPWDGGQRVYMQKRNGKFTYYFEPVHLKIKKGPKV